MVCVLFQGGEHGKLAARLATQVIKAYVEKRDRNPQKMTEKPKSNGTVDVGGLWSDPLSEGEKRCLGSSKVRSRSAEEADGNGDRCAWDELMKDSAPLSS